jgi:UDP-glucose 4-epimerase
VKALAAGAATTALNLGVGRGYSVREVIAASEPITGLKAKVIEESRRAGDCPILVADSGRAKSILGWVPRRADLEAIIADAWGWESRH